MSPCPFPTTITIIGRAPPPSRDEYTLTLKKQINAFQEISETHTPNDEYEKRQQNVYQLNKELNLEYHERH